MPTTTLTRHGFISLKATMDPRHQRAINSARDTASSFIDQLRGPAADLASDSDVTESGKQNRRRAMLAEFAKHTFTVFSAARREADSDIYKATSAITAR